MPPVLPRPEQGSAPVSLVARNACLSLRFDDLLDDDLEARLALPETVRVLVGAPPATPFTARILFDPNHGGTADGRFHSTRILIDLTISGAEAAASDVPLLLNSIGLPASLPGDARASAALRFPSRLDPGTGQFRLLTNLAGGALDREGNGPLDPASPTLDIVRALRAGGRDDANEGFLLDLDQPELLGSWPATITAAELDPSGVPGIDLLLDVRFQGACRRRLLPGAILQSGERFVEVRQASSEPDAAGSVAGVRASILDERPLASASALLGNAQFLSTYAAGLALSNACWLTILPTPGQPPDQGLSSDSRLVVRFSEPMSPVSVDPFETLLLARGDALAPLLSSDLVVAEAARSPDLRTWTLIPLLPLAPGATREYHVRLTGGERGLTDLAGNALVAVPLPIGLVLDPGEMAPENGGVVLRFDSLDELEPIGPVDLRGQFFYDFERGTVRGRPVAYESFSADGMNPVPSIMIPFGPGVQTPLSGFGSKLQTVWRHCDLGWAVLDESKHNIDVIGLSWTPVGGSVLNDFFELFELRLAHSRRQPDEFRTFTGTTYPCSGLGAGSNICSPCLTFVPYEDNILRDPRSPQVVVHDRALGYRIRATDLYVGRSGATRMPYPMNRSGGPATAFTWRDTAVLARDGIDSGGLPLLIEVGDPLRLEPGPVGRIAAPGRVPAWGLPLLIEVRCVPAQSALGLNPLEIYLAQNAQQLPVFRGFSTGGIDQSGSAVTVDPDTTPYPEGGFNPGSRPPGRPTGFQADNSFYTGELDTVVRVSRMHTAWIEALIAAPRYLPPVLTPANDQQPGAARIEVELRGASGFVGAGVTRAFDARELDPMGDIGLLEVLFHEDDGSWSSDVTRLDGARYVQVRLSFVNDVAAQVTPEHSSLGLAYTATE
jgi:hypothetical protein